jgi:hypothetical protein
MSPEKKTMWSANNPQEQIKTAEQIREIIVMRFTENVFSLLASTTEGKQSLPRIDYISISKNIYTALNRYNLNSVGIFSQAVGFDIKKSKTKITFEEEKNNVEFLLNGSSNLLSSLISKPEDQLKTGEKTIIGNYRAFQVIKKYDYTPDEISELFKEDWKKRKHA